MEQPHAAENGTRDIQILAEHHITERKGIFLQNENGSIKGTGQTHRFSLNDCTPFHAQSIRMKKLR